MPVDVEWDFYLVAAERDGAPAGELYARLSKGAKVFWDKRDIAPGDVAADVRKRAIERAGLFVVLCGDSSDDPKAAEELVRGIDVHRNDANRAVVPVLITPGAKEISGKPYGVATLHAISAVELGDWGEVTDQLLVLAKQRRAVWNRKASVAVVCCEVELGNDARAVVKEISKLTGIDVGKVKGLDSADPKSLDEARRADKVVVLVGVRTGGTDVLSMLANEDTIILAPKSPDFDNHCVDEELPVARGIRKLGRCVQYAAALDAGSTAATEVSHWLRDWCVTRPGENPMLEEWEQQYLKNSIEKWRRGAVGPLTSYAGSKKIDRADYYVPLRASKTSFCWADENGSLVVDFKAATRPDAGRESADEEKKFQDPLLEQVLSHRDLPYLVFEGEAGSGKSVLVQHVACALACRHNGCDDEDKMESTQMDLESLRAGGPILPIPILIEAKQVAAKTKGGAVQSLIDVLRDEVALHSGRAVHKEPFEAGLRRGRYLVLMDSLDEVSEQSDKQHVMDALRCFSTDPRIRSRVVLTTRPTAHTGVELTTGAFQLMKLAPIDQDTAQSLVTRWATARGYDNNAAADMWQAVRMIEDRHDIHNLVENPLLLVCSLLVYEKKRRLPDSTCDLYNEMVDILCALRPGGVGSTDPPREGLAAVFWILQTAGAVTMPVPLVTDRWAGLHHHWTESERTQRLDRLAESTGLIRFVEESVTDGESRKTKFVRAWHRSFQEYLAMTKCTSTPDSVDTIVDRLLDERGPKEQGVGVGLEPFWTGAMKFLVGVWGASEKGRACVQRLVDHVEGEGGAPKTTRPGYLLGLAAVGIAEYKHWFPEGDALRDTVRNLIVTRFEAEGQTWSLLDRLLALDYLGRIGDPRLDRDPWVNLPGGIFEMGGDEEAYSSAPKHRVRIAPLQVAWCPVTVSQYEKFVQAGGYTNKRYWAEIAGLWDRWTEPVDWKTQQRWPNRPVVGVSWYEAVAYCAWQRETTGLPVRLPTEAEWEYASKVGHNGPWPWGNKTNPPGQGDEARANYDWEWSTNGKSSIDPPRRPTPIGVFPLGNNAGITDLAGNVWEWCLDTWREDNDKLWPRGDTEGHHDDKFVPRSDADRFDVDNPCHQDDNGHRAVRGGSWGGVPWGLRCAYRDWGHPERRDGFLGFRVVCCVSVQHTLNIAR